MKDFEFVSHLRTPDDQYIKEIVVLQFIVVLKDDQRCKLRIPYARKVNKDGGLFWSEISAGISHQAQKTYVKHKFDSEFLKDDVDAYLESRAWESRVNPNHAPSAFEYPKNTQTQQTTKKEEDLPF